MTTQDLINLPGAGNAEKQLHKMGKWDFSPIEALQNIQEDHCTYSANMLIDHAIKQLEAKCN